MFNYLHIRGPLNFISFLFSIPRPQKHESENQTCSTDISFSLGRLLAYFIVSSNNSVRITRGQLTFFGRLWIRCRYSISAWRLVWCPRRKLSQSECWHSGTAYCRLKLLFEEYLHPFKEIHQNESLILFFKKTYCAPSSNVIERNNTTFLFCSWGRYFLLSCISFPSHSETLKTLSLTVFITCLQQGGQRVSVMQVSVWVKVCNCYRGSPTN